MRSAAHRWSVVACALATACGGRTADSPGQRPAGPKAANPPAPTGDADTARSSLMPDRKRGWKHVDDRQRTAIAAYAGDYTEFLSRAKTPRRAVSGLIALARNAGATELTADAHLGTAAGKLVYVRARGGDAAAIIRVGARPIEEGVRLIVANVDAPRIDLKQSPVFTDAGLALLDTAPYGQLDLPKWLAHPLALYIYAARPGASTGDIDLALGDAPDDPVLSIPDILPHLSSKPQRRGLVDSPERMNAVAAASRETLAAFLRAHGVDEAVFATAEATLVPAGPARLVGVDGALVAGYGHRHRSAAYAAVRALLEVESTPLTSIVVISSGDQAGWNGNSGAAFVATAMSAAMRALAADATALDALGTRRIYARSAALVTADLDARRNRGVALSPHTDDALPRAQRRVVDAFDAGGVAWQVVGDRTQGSQARELGTLDLDVLDFAIPATGRGTPWELASTYDLFQGYLACRAWFEHSR